MREGVWMKVPTDLGDEAELGVLCTYSYRGKDYLLTVDERELYACSELTWTPWRGTVLETMEETGEEAVRAGNALLHKNGTDPGSYPFRGEHYSVRKEEGLFRIRRGEQSGKLKKRARIIPTLARLSVLLAVALFYGYLCTLGSNITVAANLFSGLSRNKLILLIYLLQAAGAAALFLIRRRDRDLSSLFFYGIIPYNTLALVGAFRSSVWVRVAVIAVAVLFAVLRVLPQVLRAIRAKRKTRRIHFWKTAMDRCYLPFILCMCIAIIAVKILGVPVYSFSAERQESTAGELLDEAAEKLRRDVWDGCDSREKLDVLQAVCDYECATALGCEAPRVVAAYPESDDILGEYSEYINVISIHPDYLAQGSVEEVLKTLLHEARHAYQRAAADAYNTVEDHLSDKELSLECFRTIRMYRNEYENYVSGLDRFIEYFTQSVESDSRSWAEWRYQYEYHYYVEGGPGSWAIPVSSGAQAKGGVQTQ